MLDNHFREPLQRLPRYVNRRILACQRCGSCSRVYIGTLPSDPYKFITMCGRCQRELKLKSIFFKRASVHITRQTGLYWRRVGDRFNVYRLSHYPQVAVSGEILVRSAKTFDEAYAFIKAEEGHLDV